MLKRNIIANYLGQGWTAVMGLAFIPLYIQYLGMEAYGLIGVFAVMQAWLTLLDMGMTPTLNREMARFSAGAHTSQSIHDLLRSLEIICFCIAIIIALTVWAESDYLASDWLKAGKLPINEVAQAISILALVLALRFVEGIYRGSLFGLQRQVFYNVASAIFATLRHGGVVTLLAFVSPTVKAFFLWQATVSILTILVFSSAVRSALPILTISPKFKLKAITEIWKFASGVMLVTFLAILLTQIDKVLLSKLLSLESFGYYTLAATLAGVLYMIVGPITTAFYPRLVELYINKNQSLLVSTYHQGSQLVTLLTATPVMIISFFPKELIFVWSGNMGLAENVAPILSAFAIGVYLNGLMHMPAQLQLAHGWVSLGIKTNLLAVGVFVPALFWIVPTYGALGASWVWVILNACYVLFTIHNMHQKLLVFEKWTWYFFDLFLPTIGPIAIALFAKSAHTPNYNSRFYEFMFLMIVGVFSLIASIVSANQIRTKVFLLIKYWQLKLCRLIRLKFGKEEI
ncbi:MAG TPA: polysaccharide biosynthesis protein [Methylophilaceae bacterium]|nr:polysaccharide biosynthesis protein [Methylophilaceae bacterium]